LKDTDTIINQWFFKGMFMKNKLFYLLVLPLVWLLVAIISFQPGVYRVYLLAVALSAWLFLFVDPLEVTTHQLQIAAFPLMFLVVFVLLILKIIPCVAIISAIALTFILWAALLVAVSKGTAIRDPIDPALWLLCCFNFSLCMLPFFPCP
jgi:hypothetical protein